MTSLQWLDLILTLGIGAVVVFTFICMVLVALIFVEALSGNRNGE